MKVYVCGDTHCPIDISKLNSKNWPYQRNLTKDDVLVVLGDFGLLWAPKWDNEELYWAKWLTKKNCTVCFVDGNHCNFDRVYALPEDTFHGGKVGVAYEDKNGRILHLKRGEIFTFDTKKVFVMGGAQSTDKASRTEGISWWWEERPSITEENYAIDNLESIGNQVDIILTHTCPNAVLHYMIHSIYEDRDSTRDFLDWIWKNVEFKQWHFGHLHTHQTYLNKFTCHYNNMPERLI